MTIERGRILTADDMRLVPYPPIEDYGVVGDRRTAALVAADGTVDWLCLPDYDGPPLFGALLDSNRGGFWRLGPKQLLLGQQRYAEGSMILKTRWDSPEGELELTDAMAWPEDSREAALENRRVLLRRLRCVRGEVVCCLELRPRDAFDADARVTGVTDGVTMQAGDRSLGLWSSHPIQPAENAASATFRLKEGEEAWAVLSLNEAPSAWSIQRASQVLEQTEGHWRNLSSRLQCGGSRATYLRRSALAIYQLSYAPTGSLVAAPTTSLPERIGGDRNYDYRYAWVRDASLALAMLARLGDTVSAERYMGWLARLCSSAESPLQVVYRVCGDPCLPQHERADIEGYQESLPVRTGNRAAGQFQLDSLGFLAECALAYLEEGCSWYDECWETVRRAAQYTAENWRRPDSGIWELPVEQHYVSSKVMSWVTLDRALIIAERTGRLDDTTGWRQAKEEIHAEVMEHGWSERLGAFRQRYEGDNLDASALLIPVMGFLPPEHPRTLATVERIEENLTINGLVHRFVAPETPGHPDLPVGEFEGAFLPCTFWLATAHARAGRRKWAEAVLDRVESLAGEVGLFAEEVDARSGAYLGNSPLIFSHAEYIRAALEIETTPPAE